MLEPDNHLRPLSFKILVLGHVGVGKTSIIQRYCYDHFSNNYKATVGIDFGVKRIVWERQYDVELQLCDISGQERFAHLTHVFYKGATGALLVFDLTDPESLSRAVEWKIDLDHKLPGLPCVLLGNKCDQSSLIPLEDVSDVQRVQSMLLHMNVSAKRDINVTPAMHELLRAMIRQIPSTPRDPPRASEQCVGQRAKDDAVINLGATEWGDQQDEDDLCCGFI